jgi:hypothetical protein
MQRAEHEAKEIAHRQTERDEGQWFGEVQADENPAAAKLLQRYEETAEDRRVCPHLQKDLDQPTFWVEAAPELLACKECTPVLAMEEQKRANSCCLMCGRHTALRGMSVATGTLLLRGGICAECETSYEVLG